MSRTYMYCTCMTDLIHVLLWRISTQMLTHYSQFDNIIIICQFVEPFIIISVHFQRGDFSISMKAPDRIKHFKIATGEQGMYKIGQRKFPSMYELIEHYKRSPIFTNSQDEKMYLIKPFEESTMSWCVITGKVLAVTFLNNWLPFSWNSTMVVSCLVPLWANQEISGFVWELHVFNNNKWGNSWSEILTV